jgi:WD40 repeat protein
MSLDAIWKMKIRPSSVGVLVQWVDQNSQVLEAHENEVWFLQFSHNGRYLASASKDLTAILWEVRIPHLSVMFCFTSFYVQYGDMKVYLQVYLQVCCMTNLISIVLYFCVLQVVEDGLVKLRHILKGHQKAVSFVAWSPDDTMLLTCGNEESVKLWDTSTGECRHTFNKPNSCFTSCAWFPDGNRFVSGGGDKSIYMWDLEVNIFDVILPY